MKDLQRSVLLAGIVLGIGMGAFVDGIVFHELLQWHSMVSAVRPPVDLLDKQVNVFWDGVFHATAWLATAGGIALLYRAGEANRLEGVRRPFAGALLVGWAIFNLVEGVLDHHVIGLHHVNEASLRRGAWDVAFLVVSAGIGGAGATLIAGGLARAPRAPTLAPQP